MIIYLNITWGSIYIYFLSYLVIGIPVYDHASKYNVRFNIYIYILSYLVIGIRVYDHVFKYNVRFNIYIFFYLTLLLEFLSMIMHLNITWGSIYIFFYLTLLLEFVSMIMYLNITWGSIYIYFLSYLVIGIRVYDHVFKYNMRFNIYIYFFILPCYWNSCIWSCI